MYMCVTRLYTYPQFYKRKHLRVLCECKSTGQMECMNWPLQLSCGQKTLRLSLVNYSGQQRFCGNVDHIQPQSAFLNVIINK